MPTQNFYQHPPARRESGFWKPVSGLLLVLLLTGGVARQSMAGDWGGVWSLNRWLSPACACCADDYCRKPLPCAPREPAPCCSDTYCGKPLPGVPCSRRGCAEGCYQTKPLPAVPCCHEPWYRCGPACASRQSR